jgi:hypothetical protein
MNGVSKRSTRVAHIRHIPNRVRCAHYRTTGQEGIRSWRALPGSVR